MAWDNKPFEVLDALFDKAETVLTGDSHPLETMQAMHKLMKGFYEYLEEKLDDTSA